MEITEVRIKLTQDSDDRLQAFCSITFDDCFVVRDLKVIEGTNGPFVAMPSRKLTSHCPRCGSKNHLRANHCNQCGARLNPDRAPRDTEGRAKLYADIAHPINSRCREMIQERVISAYRDELELAKSPDYVSRYDDEYDDDFSLGDLRDDTGKAAKSDPVEPPATIQRTDEPQTGTGSLNIPDPHTGNTPQTAEAPPVDESQPSPAAPPPHMPPRRKPGFGAGILDE